jgi:hypothetical protein
MPGICCRTTQQPVLALNDVWPNIDPCGPWVMSAVSSYCAFSFGGVLKSHI